MELGEYLRILRKRAWMILLAAVVLGLAAYIYGVRQTRMYTASVMISVGGYIQSPNPNTTEIRPVSSSRRPMPSWPKPMIF